MKAAHGAKVILFGSGIGKKWVVFEHGGILAGSRGLVKGPLEISADWMGIESRREHLGDNP